MIHQQRSNTQTQCAHDVFVKMGGTRQGQTGEANKECVTAALQNLILEVKCRWFKIKKVNVHNGHGVGLFLFLHGIVKLSPLLKTEV